MSACGNVTFVDAPFAPRKIVVLYSDQEDLTVVRWRMSARQSDPAVGFELLDSKGSWQTVDFSTAPYPSGVAVCGDRKGLCGQLVISGRYQPPDDVPTPLRSRNPTYDISPGDGPTRQRSIKTLTLTGSYFMRGNAVLATTITDVIGGDGVFRFPRPLERSLWERRGVCIPGFFPADAQFSPVDGLDNPWTAPATLSATGQYCAAVRAIKANGDRGADDQLATDTMPDVHYGDHHYTVPLETTPFSYQIVLDLSIPVADRCQEATQMIQAIVAQTLGAYSPLRTLPVVDLGTAIDPDTGMPGTRCRQAPRRALDAAGLAQQVKVAAASWTEQHQRYFLIYFNNLRAPLPNTLMTSLYTFSDTLVTPPPTVDFAAAIWPFGPPEMVQSFQGWGMQQTSWSSATDLDFVQELKTFGENSLPLTSEIQDPNALVMLLSPDDAQRLQNGTDRLDGGSIRLCQVSITPLQSTGLQLVSHSASGDLVYLPPALSYPVRKSDPPAYLLNVPPVWAMPRNSFTAHESHVRYEICTRYCDHAFTGESGVPVANPPGWAGSSLCMGPP